MRERDGKRGREREWERKKWEVKRQREKENIMKFQNWLMSKNDPKIR